MAAHPAGGASQHHQITPDGWRVQVFSAVCSHIQGDHLIAQLLQLQPLSARLLVPREEVQDNGFGQFQLPASPAVPR